MSDFMSPTLAWGQYFSPVIGEETLAQALFTPESLHIEQMKNREEEKREHMIFLFCLFKGPLPGL